MSLVEQPALRLLSQLGWEVASAFDEVFGAAGTLGRDSRSEPVLGHRLRVALRTLNPGLSEAALLEAAERLVEDRSAMDRVRANREVYDLLRVGVRVETTGSDGERRTVTVRFVDWNEADANDWLAVSQYWITGDMYKRRADVVLFVNGIPLVFIRVEGLAQERPQRVRRELAGLPRHGPASVLVQRVRNPVQRRRHPRRFDVRFLGSLRGVEEDQL